MKFKRKINKLLGDVLVERDVITQDQLKEALTVQSREGGLLGEIIVHLGFASEEDIAQAISLQYGFPYLPLTHYEIPDEIKNIIPKTVAQHYCLIAIDKISNTLTLTMANPLNIEAVEDIEDMTSLDIQLFVSTSSDIRNAIEKYYL